MFSLKKTAYILVAGASTTAALVYALWGVDFALLMRLLAGADFRVLAPFLGLLAGFYFLTGWRWNLLLRPLGRFTLTQSGPAMMIGFAGNNVFPAHLGEVARAIVFGRRYTLPVSSVLASLVGERILDVFAILFFYFLAVLVLDPFPESFRFGVEAAAAVTAAGCVGIVFFLRFPGTFLALYRRLAFWLPRGLREKGAGLLKNSMDGLAALKTPHILLALLVLSLAKWLVAGGMVWLALAAFDTSISFGVTMIVIAVSALAVTVPSAPGYVGAIQAAFVFALVPFGVPQEVALASSVFYLVSQWVPVTIFGGACFAATRLRRGELQQEPEKVF
ncbi:MAG: flippase-like domain-containing protein [SAR324 cluster bacterium]|nr:flippase-like domain-containing protein [SAR324 cluster bacterium]